MAYAIPNQEATNRMLLSMIFKEVTEHLFGFGGPAPTPYATGLSIPLQSTHILTRVWEKGTHAG